MKFIEPKLTVILKILDKLAEETTPKWGEMKAIEMVEHLTSMLKIASGKLSPEQVVPLEMENEARAFLDSDEWLKKNLKASFYPIKTKPFNDNLSDAIDEFSEEWIAFEAHYQNDENIQESHPYFGPLNFKQWQRLHSKHFSHHFLQFGLI